MSSFKFSIFSSFFSRNHLGLTWLMHVVRRTAYLQKCLLVPLLCAWHPHDRSGQLHFGPIVNYISAGPPVDADEYSCVEPPAVDNTFQRFVAAIIESARFTKCKKTSTKLFASDPLICGATIMAFGAPRDQCCCMGCHPCHQRMSNWNSLTDLVLEVTPQCPHMALHELDSHFSRSIGLGVILRRMLLEDL